MCAGKDTVLPCPWWRLLNAGFPSRRIASLAVAPAEFVRAGAWLAVFGRKGDAYGEFHDDRAQDAHHDVVPGSVVIESWLRALARRDWERRTGRRSKSNRAETAYREDFSRTSRSTRTIGSPGSTRVK